MYISKTTWSWVSTQWGKAVYYSNYIKCKIKVIECEVFYGIGVWSFWKFPSISFSRLVVLENEYTSILSEVTIVSYQATNTFEQGKTLPK